MTKFYIITTFPESIEGYTKSSILKRAQEKKLISIEFVNPRDFTKDKHKKTDDRPYGGGPGMVLFAEPILRAVKKIKTKLKNKKVKVILFSPSGKQFTNILAKNISKKYDAVILICGRYEGVDARVKKILKAEEISVGPYVLTGGEIPALIVVDAVSRQIKGVLGKSESIEENRVSSKEMYTRPEVLEWEGKKYRVPSVLKTGHHKNIDNWRKEN